MEENREIEIDLRAIFSTLKKKLVIMILIALLCGTFAGCFTNFFVEPKYTATITLCAYNDNDRIGADGSITTSEIEASQELVNTYIEILKSDTFLQKVADNLQYDISPSAIKGMLSCSQVESTFIFKVRITGTNASEAMDIANTIAEICPDELIRIVSAGSIQIVDYAKLPTTPSSPNLKKIVAVALLAGFVVSFAVFFLKEVFDTSINEAKDLEKEFTIPVLGTIPKLLPVDNDASKDNGNTPQSSLDSLNSLLNGKGGNSNEE